MNGQVYADGGRSVQVAGVAVPPLGLPGILQMPVHARGLVIFAHGSASSRLSPRNNYVANALSRADFATLLFDLLSSSEEADRTNVFDIPLLADRLNAAVVWAEGHRQLQGLPLGLFGASTDAAGALVAAALEEVRAPTLLIVGGCDLEVLALNEEALARLPREKSLKVIPGATHLFQEPGTLDRVVEEAAAWFRRHLARAGAEPG